VDCNKVLLVSTCTFPNRQGWRGNCEKDGIKKISGQVSDSVPGYFDKAADCSVNIKSEIFITYLSGCQIYNDSVLWI
jgi:hypothetical protein